MILKKSPFLLLNKEPKLFVYIKKGMVFFTENGSNLLFLGVKTGKCPLSIETGHFNRNRTLQSKPDTSDDTGHFGKNRTNMSKNGQNWPNLQKGLSGGFWLVRLENTQSRAGAAGCRKCQTG